MKNLFAENYRSLKYNMGGPSAYRCTKLDCYAEGRIIVLALDTGVACITGYGAHTAPSTAPPIVPPQDQSPLPDGALLPEQCCSLQGIVIAEQKSGRAACREWQRALLLLIKLVKTQNPSEELKRTLGCQL